MRIKIEGLFIAILLPAIIYGMASQSFSVFILVSVVSALHAIILAIPLLLVMTKLNCVNRITSSISGFLIGSIPIALWSWPLSYSDLKTTSSNSTYGQTMIDDVPTSAAWEQYIHTILYFGVFGLASGIIFGFYMHLRNRSPNQSLKHGTPPISGAP